MEDPPPADLTDDGADPEPADDAEAEGETVELSETDLLQVTSDMPADGDSGEAELGDDEEDELLAAVEATDDEEDEEDDPEETLPPARPVPPVQDLSLTPVPPPRPTDSLRKAARLRMATDTSGGQPTPHVLIPDPPRAGEEHGDEQRFVCYFGAAIFVGATVESVSITEVSASGVRILADRSKLAEGDEVRLRAHVDLPNRGGLLDLTILCDVAWTDDVRDKFHAGLTIESVKPMDGYAKLLAGLSRRKARSR